MVWPYNSEMKRPNPGTIQGRVLGLLERGPVTLQTARLQLELDEKQFRSGIDGLRVKGWQIDLIGPYQWSLVEAKIRK